MRAKKSLGQNFLHETGVIEKITSTIAPISKDILLEIGPGLGALTLKILHQANKLFAIEIDGNLASILSNKLKANLSNSDFNSNFNLFVHDVMQFDFVDFVQKYNIQKLRVFGNLPYNISSQILFKLLSIHAQILDMHFMFQKELAERLTASVSTKKYGRLTVMAKANYDIEKLFDVKSGSFNPKPKIDSSFMKFTPNNMRSAINNYALFERLIAAAFSSRRKKLHNSLENFFDIKLIKEIMAVKLPVINANLFDKRAEEIDINTYIELSNYFNNL